MKGYVTAMGYMGLVEGRYLLFCSESDYEEYVRELMETPDIPEIVGEAA